jgi:hypothetical protein
MRNNDPRQRLPTVESIFLRSYLPEFIDQKEAL